MIAVLCGIAPDEALAYVGAVINVRFDVAEISLNSPQWEQNIPVIVDACGDKALIDAGTILKPEQVNTLVGTDRQPIVMPNIHSEVIHCVVGYSMTACPGCAATIGAFIALEVGAQALKILPLLALDP